MFHPWAPNRRISSIEYIKAGKPRALAVTTVARSDLLPEIPAMSDFVPGYEVSNWFGIGVPKNTPVEVIDELNREVNAGLADPELKVRFVDLGGTVLARQRTSAGSSPMKPRNGPR